MGISGYLKKAAHTGSHWPAANGRQPLGSLNYSLLVTEGQLSKVTPPLPISLVLESWVVLLEL